MKNHFKLFPALLLMSAGMLAAQGLSAQQRVFKVQGHPHGLLTRQVHGFVFEPNFVVPQFDGTQVYVNCACAPCTEENKESNK
jgi:hypothetical protein